MGGKRPDQYQIDPGEGRATDYKTLRRAEDGIAGHVPDRDERKRTAAGRGLIPPAVPNPEVERLREKAHKDADGDVGDYDVEDER